MTTDPLILVGGGLANSLVALRVRARHPGVRIVVVDAAARLGGNHTWSFHETDLSPDQISWTAPLVCHSWPAHEVCFPAYRRRIESGYRSITSTRLHEVVAATAGLELVLGRRATAVEPTRVHLEDGRILSGSAVIDGRGVDDEGPMLLRFQKFLGQEIELAAAHGLDVPILMDARVPQVDGYRFVYVLPLAPTRLLIEDTYYADGAALDLALLRRRIAAYAAQSGWTVARVVREEHGALPIVLGGDGPPRHGAVPRAGLRAGLFHHTTGYSLPDAVRLADAIAALPALDAATIGQASAAVALDCWRRHRFSRLLNRMLFLAARPAERFRVLQRFYRLPAPLIARFYAGRSTFGDRCRILSGRPPVNLLRAFGSLMPGAAARTNAGAAR